jgi:hypothetical protein
MGEGIATYGDALRDAISACPKGSSHMEVLRRTVAFVSSAAAEQPRTRKVVQIARTSPGARQAQVSRLADVEDRVAQAFAARCKRGDEVTPRMLAKLLLAAVEVTINRWYDADNQPVSAAADVAFSTLSRIVCGEGSSRLAK